MIFVGETKTELRKTADKSLQSTTEFSARSDGSFLFLNSAHVRNASIGTPLHTDRVLPFGDQTT